MEDVLLDMFEEEVTWVPLDEVSTDDAVINMFMLFLVSYLIFLQGKNYFIYMARDNTRGVDLVEATVSVSAF